MERSHIIDWEREATSVTGRDTSVTGREEPHQ